jgi:hypothetical protein
MNTSDSFSALRRANPRARRGFATSVEAAEHEIQARLATEPVSTPRRRPRRRTVRISVASASAAAVAAGLAFLAVGSLSSGPGIEDAAAAVQKAATLTAASAERSGTAEVRITHGGELWAGTTVVWNGHDIATSRLNQSGDRRPGAGVKMGAEWLVVDGVLYGIDPEVEGGWIAFGDPSSIDPDSGTTPSEYLAAVREDVGGATLRRITHGMTGLTRTELADGSAVYRGTVASGLLARETGYKEGQFIRVLPFGYVAHDEAADPASPLDTAITVDANGIVHEIVMTWGSGSSTWRYSVTYNDLGSTPAPAAPANARSLREWRFGGQRPTPPGGGN